MVGEGPFLWLSPSAPPAGFRRLLHGGMCLSVFLFVRRGKRILLGRYADDPAWEVLAGLDPEWRRLHGRGWTIPATQVKFGEEILTMRGMRYTEPRVETDYYEPARSPGQMHLDVWFIVDAVPPRGAEAPTPAWYAELAWKDPRTMQASEYARSHEDVVARWMQRRALRSGSPT